MTIFLQRKETGSGHWGLYYLTPTNLCRITVKTGHENQNRTHHARVRAKARILCRRSSTRKTRCKLSVNHSVDRAVEIDQEQHLKNLLASNSFQRTSFGKLQYIPIKPHDTRVTFQHVTREETQKLGLNLHLNNRGSSEL